MRDVISQVPLQNSIELRMVLKMRLSNGVCGNGPLLVGSKVKDVLRFRCGSYEYLSRHRPKEVCS